MFIKQLSVFVENEPGKLVEATEVLGQAGVDMKAMCIADTNNFGVLRFIANHPKTAEQALKDQGFMVSQTEVIGVGIADRPGGLSAALHILSNAGISVEYLYAFLGRDEGTAFVIIRVEDNAAAKEVLEANGIRLLDGTEIQ